MSEIVEYNGYTFNEYSDCTISASMRDDDAGRTTIYHDYKLRVETTIYAEDGDVEGIAGAHFQRIRDRLTKKGQVLVISHGGFSDSVFDVNLYQSGQRDVRFGPHPRIVTWEPVGYENAVHVVWECEFCLSACNRYSGIMALNYQMSHRIDTAGYTTRTISGYIEIAMTRVGRSIPDTADAYRDAIIVGQMANFQRETSWNLSADKRRAEFTIVDTEIKSPNAFAPGIVNISATHDANWSLRRSERLPQTIRATIELAQGVPRSRAWEVFRAIVNKRFGFSNQAERFIEHLAAEESLFSNSISFSISYYTFVKPNESIMTGLAGIFASTGLCTPLDLATWQQWKLSIASLQSHRGQAGLQHDPTQDQIVDLCSTEFQPGGVVTNNQLPNTPLPLSLGSLYNQKPMPAKSYLRYDSSMECEEDTPTTTQVSVDADDGEYQLFDPNIAEAELAKKASGSSVRRFVETQAGKIYFWWRGYAERVGYPIPRPDKIEVNGVTFKRVTGRFVQQFKGNVLGQPVYRAAWVMKYVCVDRPEKMQTKDIDDWEL